MAADPLSWPIDLRGLYGARGWAERGRFGLQERLFPAPERDACLVLYHVGEIDIHKQVGKLAIFRDRTRPRRVHHAGWTLFWDDAPRWSVDGRVAFLPECVRDGGGYRSGLCAFDLEGSRWARCSGERAPERLEGLRWKPFRRFGFWSLLD